MVPRSLRLVAFDAFGLPSTNGTDLGAKPSADQRLKSLPSVLFSSVTFTPKGLPSALEIR